MRPSAQFMGRSRLEGFRELPAGAPGLWRVDGRRPVAGSSLSGSSNASPDPDESRIGSPLTPPSSPCE